MRKNRIWYPGASYHVTTRGIRRSVICNDPYDFEMFCAITKNVKQTMPFKLHSFCMMTNHLHMQITTCDIEIWTIMRRLLSNYARSFNFRYGYTGHLFESRYTSNIIENPTYFLEVSRYIHLNPVKAGIVQNPMDYPYSSYASYVKERPDSLLSKNEILDFFSGNKTEAYRRYVEE